MAKTALERAARALCRTDGHPENIQFEGKPMWQSYLPNALAALRAIREPSEAMIGAGSGITHADLAGIAQAHHVLAERDRDDAAEAWRNMVDAAIEEGA